MAAQPQTSHDRVPALDLLRLVAVLAVVVFHYGYAGPTALGTSLVALPQLAPVAQYGFLGVSAFFVISGFVIAYSAENRTPGEFAIARFVRIYPTFVLCMTLTWLAVFWFGEPNFRVTAAQWVSNLMIGAPRSRYVDSAYWSLVIEVIFYGWVALLMRLGAFQKHKDIIIAAWLLISALNAITLDANWVGKLLLADYSGFFATGILIYQLHIGRRDAVVLALLAAATMTAVTQAEHSMQWLRQHHEIAPDGLTVAAVCVASMLAIGVATRIRTLPAWTLALGGMTYPLYLLHQQIGYAIVLRSSLDPEVAVPMSILTIGALSYVIWRFVEGPLQQPLKRFLGELTARIAFRSEAMRHT